MKRAILLLFLVSIPLYASDNVFDSAIGHACFRELLRKSSWGLAGPYERAAFVVEQTDGSIQCVEWPAMHISHSEIFRGQIPERTVAIAHTHPVEYPLPSPNDQDEATRLGIAIYTITIRAVYKTLPHDLHSYVIANEQSWIRKTPKTSLTATLRPDELPVDLQGNRLPNK